MTEPMRRAAADPAPDATTSVRTQREPAGDEDAVGYARADLKDALARIRGTTGPRALDDLERGRSSDRTIDDRIAVEELRALGERIDRLSGLIESVGEATTALAAASSRNEERLARVAEAVETARVAHVRAERRTLWLSLVLAVLAVVVGMLAAVQILG